MSDIVERLRRSVTKGHEPTDEDAIEAADEIERLRALTAAAEVGEKLITWEMAIHQDEIINAEIRTATIERCAQVADSFHAYDRPAAEIAAAIRALKDEK